MTNEQNIIGFLMSSVGQIVSVVSDIFRGVIGFVPHLLEYMMSIFSFLIFIIPFIFGIILYAITHFYIVLIIAECVILVRVIITRGFMNKLSTFFDSHIIMFKAIINLPSYLTTLMQNLFRTFDMVMQSLIILWDVVSGIFGYVVSLASSNIVTAVIGLGLLITGLIAVMSIVHI